MKIIGSTHNIQKLTHKEFITQIKHIQQLSHNNNIAKYNIIMEVK